MSKDLFNRILRVNVPNKQSAFLWGARKTGKSSYLKTYFPKSVYYDLLKTDLYLKLSKNPEILRQEILALDKKALQLPIIIDEIQLIPTLMNEIHWLIENSDAYFILCGSSARKMKQQNVNFLGGRAWKYTMFPLTYQEIQQIDLLKIFNHGTIPSHYTSPDIMMSLKAYVEDYLTQEIRNEGLVRNLPAFARFLDSIAFSNTQLINYSNIASDCGVDSKTIKEYYQILVDTLLGYFVYPVRKNPKRNIISSLPKFYLFDVGVANYLSKKKIQTLKSAEAGISLEHFILLELKSYIGYNNLPYEIHYWRTKSGLEVDFIINDVAIEVKISTNIHNKDLKGLIAYAQDYHPNYCFIVCQVDEPRLVENEQASIILLPIKEFLNRLWAGEII